MYSPRIRQLVNSLFGWWCPNITGYTGGKLLDLSGHGGHGTLTNMDPYTDWGSDQYGRYIDLDGSNDYVDIPNPGRTNSMISPTSSVSIFVRVSPNTAQVSRNFVSNAGNPTIGGCGLGIDDSTNNKIKWVILNSGGSYSNLVSATAIASNSMSSVCGTFKLGAGVTHNHFLYINGNLDNSLATSLVYAPFAAANPNLNIGRWPGGASQLFNGRVYEVMWFNAFLPRDQVAWLHQLGLGGLWRYRHGRAVAYAQPQIDLIAKRRRRKGDQTEPVPWWTW